mmetsp:Transcript_160373/g.514668  ORF Transcript_160373/g.514668 Transcript_160373/m.514668 type:complete len:206 (-) Transcript_160373:1160-1777(-)
MEQRGFALHDFGMLLVDPHHSGQSIDDEVVVCPPLWLSQHHNHVHRPCCDGFLLQADLTVLPALARRLFRRARSVRHADATEDAIGLRARLGNPRVPDASATAEIAAIPMIAAAALPATNQRLGTPEDLALATDDCIVPDPDLGRPPNLLLHGLRVYDAAVRRPVGHDDHRGRQALCHRPLGAHRQRRRRDGGGGGGRLLGGRCG